MLDEAQKIAAEPDVVFRVGDEIVWELPGPTSEPLSQVERKYVRRLKLFEEALPLVRQEPAATEDVGRFYDAFVDLFADRATRFLSLSELTKTDVVPEFERLEDALRRSRGPGAPVDAEGNPIFYETPESYETARSDGERLFSLEEELLRLDPSPGRRARVLLKRAERAEAIYGVETASRYRFVFNSFGQSDPASASAEKRLLRSLSDSETLARFANGLLRVELPPNYAYLQIWREVVDNGPEYYLDETLPKIAREYRNRLQYDKEGEIWKRLSLVGRIGDRDRWKKELSTVVDPIVFFDSSSAVDGVDARLKLRYRNATEADLVVKRLDVGRLLELVHTKEYLETTDHRFRESLGDAIRAEVDPEDSRRETAFFVEQSRATGKKIVGEIVARETIALDPDPNRFDRIAPVEFPVRESGAYLVEVYERGKICDAAIVWLNDVLLYYGSYDDGRRYFAFDATTGKPLPKRRIDFFAFARDASASANRSGFRPVVTKSLSRTTDKDGSIFLSSQEFVPGGAWQIFAIAPKSKDSDASSGFAFLDFITMFSTPDLVRRQREIVRPYEGARALFVSDRPVYRPGQKAEFRFVVLAPPNGENAENKWRDREVELSALAPDGTEAFRKRVRLDSYGSVSDSLELGGDAPLGIYKFALTPLAEDAILVTADDPRDPDPYRKRPAPLGEGEFRLEEALESAFQVTIEAPADPVALGEKFKAKIVAKYPDGAPVSRGRVSSRVFRANRYASYRPAHWWNGLYGPDCEDFASSYEWYPGWKIWGCVLYGGFDSFEENLGISEFVLEDERILDENGTCEIEIDSSRAKALFPNDDQEYSIVAEVVDGSRDTVVASGKVLATRSSFEARVRLDRGYYRAGDKMNLEVEASRRDGKPVAGTAAVKLFKIAYEKTPGGSVKPRETEVFASGATLDENGRGALALSAKEPGQYRVSVVVLDRGGSARESGQIVAVLGAERGNANRGDFRFNDLEIIPDKWSYAVGDVARVLIASSYPDATVLLVERPKYGAAVGAPRFIRLKNGTATAELNVSPEDRDSILVQATSVFNGKFHQARRILPIPPENRALKVAVAPDAKRVVPGAKTRVEIRLTDSDDKPVAGRAIVAIYDKSLEAISGGSNVPDPREFFLKPAIPGFGENSTIYKAPTFESAYEFYLYPRKSVPRYYPREAPDAPPPEPVDRRLKELPPLVAPSTPTALINLARRRGFRVYNRQERRGLTLFGAGMGGGFDESSSNELFGFFVKPSIRENLSSLAFWGSDLESDADGKIAIEVDLPENIATWKVRVWSFGEKSRVGSGETEIVASKNLVVSARAPLFLTRGDEVVLSAIARNDSEREKKVQVALEFPIHESESSAARLSLLDGDESAREIVVPAGGEARVDRIVRAETSGVATLVAKALTDEESDAIRKTIPIVEREEEPSRSDSGFQVERRYFKLVEKSGATTSAEDGQGRPIDLEVARHDRVPLASGDSVALGETVEVELLFELDRDRDSIVLEDRKPAGFESVESTSERVGGERGFRVERRDDRVLFFAERAPKGRSVASYRLLAETPGAFSALPTKLWSESEPERKGIGEEFKIRVVDASFPRDPDLQNE